MKKLAIILFSVILFSGCATVEHEPQPSKIVETTVDGKKVLMYVTGYSIEDFLCEFHTNQKCVN